MVKKGTSLLLVFFILFSLTACKQKIDENSDPVLTSEDDYIGFVSGELVRYLTDPTKKEDLKALFCERIQSNPDFEQHIDELYSFMQCDGYVIAEYSTLPGSNSSGWKDGKRTSWSTQPDIPYLKGISSANGLAGEYSYFSISYNYQILSDKFPETIGLRLLEVRLINGPSYRIGEPI